MLASLPSWRLTGDMGIEFIEQPPRKVGDVRLDERTEKTSIGYYAEFGFDPMWVQIGGEDTSVVFENILEHAAPTDTIDFETMKAMLYDVADSLTYEGLQKSYKRGVDLYIDRMIEQGRQNQAQ